MSTSRVIAEVLINAKAAIKEFQNFSDGGKAALEDLASSAQKAGKDISGSIDDAGKSFKDFISQAEEAGRTLRNVGAVLTTVITVPLIALGKSSHTVWSTQAEAIALVEVGLKNMGDAIGFTSQEIQDMASGLQGITKFGDEDILANVSAEFIKFGNITGENFKRAQKAALDFAEFTQGDLSTAGRAIGRALQDPVRGLMTLERQLGFVPEATKTAIEGMIEMGDVAGAQALILNHLEGSIGGTAEAMARVGTGPMVQAWNAVGDAIESIGEIVEPAVHMVADWIKAAAEAFSSLSKETKTIIVIVGAVVAAIGPVVMALGLIVLSIGPVVAGFGALIAAATAVIGVITGMAAPVLAIGGLIAGLAFLIYNHWDGIVQHTETAWNAVWKPIEAVAGWIRQKYNDLTKWLADAFNGAVASVKDAFDGFLAWFDSTFIGRMIAGIGRAIDAVKKLIAALKQAASTPVPAPAAGAAGGGTFARGGPVWGAGTATSDSIDAKLSAGEFVIRAKAVKHYGQAFFRKLNAMKLKIQGFAKGGAIPRAVRGMVPKFSMGGLVPDFGSMMPQHQLAFAGGGGVDAQDRPRNILNLTIDGQRFEGLLVPDEVADSLTRYAVDEQSRSGGRKPGWYS